MSSVTVLRAGDRHPHVAELRRRLATLGYVDRTSPDPELFDERLSAAVREFQQQRGLHSDAVVGPDTSSALESARWQLGDRILQCLPGHFLVGDDVSDLQGRLMRLGFTVRKVDGVFGPETEQGVRAFQRSSGLPADGVVGPDTLRAFAGLHRAVSGGAPHALRELEAVQGKGGRLAGRTFVIDPGHAGAADDPRDDASAWAMLDVARRVEGRLTAVGVTVVFTHTESRWPSEAERADLANSVDADLAVSLYCDRSASPSASGVAAFYFGNDSFGASSPIGKELAEILVREVSARTGLPDCRAHAQSWAFLTRTAMPSVRLEAGYVSNTADASRLADPVFRDALAEAIVVAIQRVYLGERDLSQTGKYDLSELRALI